MRIARSSILGLLGASAPAGVSAWATGTGYARWTTVSHQGRLYKTVITITAGSSASTSAPGTVAFWAFVGPAYSDWTAGTNAAVSMSSAWSFSATYAVGDSVYDSFALQDYICMVAHTSSTATRPVLESVDASTQRKHWASLGASNAFKMVDGKAVTRTIQTGATLTANVVLSTPATLVGVFGIRGCSSVTARAYRANNTTTAGDLRTFSMSYSEGSLLKSKILFTPTASEIEHGYIWRFTFAKASEAPTVEVGQISAGTATDFGMCKVQPSVSGLTFSNTKYDETFGDVKFVKRGFANQVSCEIYTEQARQDMLVTTLNQFMGEPVLIDLNNETQYEHLAMWGFYETYSADYYGWDNADTKISLTLKSLVEE